MRIGNIFDRYLFTPPFRFLPAALFVFLIFDTACHPTNAFWTHNLSDPDDYMRLNQVINWLTGQGWYDVSQPRMSPGMGTVVHWARLVDLPIAVVMLPLLHFMDMRAAAMMASLIVPPILFLALLVAVPRLSRPLLGRRYGNIALVILVFAPNILYNYSPGRVDHHGYSIIIAAIGLGSLHHMLLCRGGWRSGIVAGVAFACGLWIGTEIMVSLLMTAGSLALASAWRGGVASRNAAVFGISLATASVFVLPFALPPGLWGERSISWFSSAAVIFSLLMAVVFVVAWLTAEKVKTRQRRLLTIIGSVVVAGATFVYFVPDTLIGPFANYDKYNSTVALDNITEAIPYYHKLVIKFANPFSWLSAIGNFFQDVLASLLAIFACLYAAYVSSPRRRILWLINAAMITVTLLLTFFYQTRVMWFLNLYRLAPLAWLTANFWTIYGKRWPEGKRILGGALVFFFVGPFTILIPLTIVHHINEPDPLKAAASCHLRKAAAFLDDPKGYGQKPVLVFAPTDEGPEILFRTPHEVVGGNFNVAGNQDVFDFYSSREDAKAGEILRRWHAAVVLACRSIPQIYTGQQHIKIGENAFIKPGSDGRLHLVSSLTDPTMIERLVSGHVPSWLKPVEINGNQDYLVYDVQTDNLPPQIDTPTENASP